VGEGAWYRESARPRDHDPGRQRVGSKDLGRIHNGETTERRNNPTTNKLPSLVIVTILESILITSQNLISIDRQPLSTRTHRHGRGR
jgi:hypothetical protein